MPVESSFPQALARCPRRAFAAVVLALALPAVAAPLTFDATFGTAGKVSTNVIRGPSDDLARAVAVQADGKTVVAGACKAGALYAYCVVRYDAAGNLDATFGQGGVAVARLGDGDANARAVVLDGTKIVVAGSCSTGGDRDFCVVRYLADGTLDTSFNGNGVAITPVGTGADDAWAVAMDGTRVLVAGECEAAGGTKFCLARYLANGTLDPAYGTVGKTLAGFTQLGGAPRDAARAVVVSSGNALVAGGCAPYAFQYACIARFDANGVLDPTFGGGGMVYSDFGTANAPVLASAIALSGSRIVVVGACAAAGKLAFCMLRVNGADGSPDVVLGPQGYATIPMGPDNNLPSAVAVSGSLAFVSGACESGGHYRFCFVALADTGGVPGSFNNGFPLIDDFGTGDNMPTGLAITFGPLLTLAGSCGADNAKDFCVTRYSQFGQRDTSLNTTGLLIHDVALGTGLDLILTLVRQPDGKLLASGECFVTEFHLCLVRFNADGTIDTGFGQFGFIVPTALPSEANNGRIALDSQNRILLAGACNSGATPCVTRYLPNGAVDTSFGILGTFLYALPVGEYMGIAGVSILGDDSVVLGGTCYLPSTLSDFCWLKLTAGGGLDSAFGTGGRRYAGLSGTPQAFAVASDATGHMIAGGCGTSCIARVTLAGQLDPGFGGGTGRVTILVGGTTSAAQAIALQGGKIVIGGVCYTGATSQFCLARLLADGSPDATFSGDGKVSIPFGPYYNEARALLPDGTGVIAGGACSLDVNGIDNDICLARVLADGTLDPAFNDGGTFSSSLIAGTSRIRGLVRAGNRVIAGAECGAGGGDFCLAAFTLLPNDLPRAPAVTGVTGGDAQAAVAFTPPSDDGGSAIVQYTATCGAHGISGPASPLTVVGLVNGVTVGCTVTATNANGTGPASDPPVSVTPRKVTSVTLASSANPTTAGVYVTLTAAVVGQAPSGTVEIRDGGILILGCQLSLTGGAASCSVNSLAAGTHSLTAHYLGDVANTPSASGTLNLSVLAPGTNLTIVKGGLGQGTVTSSPAGIACGATCLSAFAPGTQVTLTAVAAPGSSLLLMANCDSTSGNQCTVTMSAARSVTVFFTLTDATLTIAKAGTGSGRVVARAGQVDCGSTCNASLPLGTVVKLQHAANAGSMFAGWSGACTGTGACEVTMDAAKNVTATFTLATPGALSVTQSATPAAVGAGKDVIYAIAVTNTGANPVSGATVVDTTAPDTQFIWASPGCAHTAGVVTCSLGTLAAGAGASPKVVVRPSVAGAITNNVVAGGTGAGANSYSSLTTPVNTSPVAAQALRYRLYSDVTKEHHFTTDLNEYTVLGTYVGTWVQEGNVGKVLDNPGSFGGVTAMPYYRLYDNGTRWHHWTTDANEYYTLGFVYSGWSMEGVDGYIMPTQAPGTIQLYRLNYPALGALHHWTIDANEYNTLITPAYGWVGEGGSGFVIP